MGCICWPVLLWRLILPATRLQYTRRFISLFVCGLLLVSSVSRASLAAASVSSMFLLLGARRFRTLLVGMGLIAAVLINMSLVTPERFQNASDALLYKKAETGSLIGSRGKPWERSVSTFREHPWLGVGFGVAENSADWHFGYATQGQLTRERGSSYLTMLEGTGAVGSFFSGLLILALLREIWRIFSRLRYTGQVNQPAVVAGAIVLGGLVNAFFEDWLFAVGYYMSVIFWVLALSLRDWTADTTSLPVTPAMAPGKGGQPLPLPWTACVETTRGD
jgi:O-antigen ligase